MKITLIFLLAYLLVNVSSLSLRKAFSGLTADQRTQQIFDKFDINKDGLIENDQFQNYLQEERVKGQKLDKFDQDLGFLMIDTKGDGKLDKQEVKAFVQKEQVALETDQDPFQENKIAAAIMKKFDKNKLQGLDQSQLYDLFDYVEEEQQQNTGQAHRQSNLERQLLKIFQEQQQKPRAKKQTDLQRHLLKILEAKDEKVLVQKPDVMSHLTKVLQENTKVLKKQSDLERHLLSIIQNKENDGQKKCKTNPVLVKEKKKKMVVSLLNKFDENGDGKIDEKELLKMLQKEKEKEASKHLNEHRGVYQGDPWSLVIEG